VVELVDDGHDVRVSWRAGSPRTTDGRSPSAAKAKPENSARVACRRREK